MTVPESVHVWPPELPSHFDGFYDFLEKLIDDCTVTAVAEITAVVAGDDSPPDSVVIVIDPTATSGPTFTGDLHTAIESIRTNPDLNAVFIVGDGYLGTDSADLGTTMHGAAAVSAVRSLALTRSRPGRSNVICVPDAMFDTAGTQRGPLTQSTEAIDVAHSIAFLLGETGQYVSGQTLFLNGGRHLFSSHTA